MNSTFIIIKSCWPNLKRRQACRDTWLTRLGTDWADYCFLVGAHAPVRLYANPLDDIFNEPKDIQAYMEDDGFRVIGRKLQHAFRGLCAKLQYERIVVVDDDTYVITEQLRELVQTVLPADYVGFLRNGAGSWGAMRYMQGSGYVLGSAAAKICSVNRGLTGVIPDDVAVGAALEPYHITFRHDGRFDPGPKPAAIWMTDFITTHKVDPEQMRLMHQHWLENENAI